MYREKRILAVITARGGSKGLPGKNVRELRGKPLIAWSIEAAKESAYIDRLIVSTDDEAIAEISRSWGAEVPFMRPAELSGDTATSVDVLKHAVDFVTGDGGSYDYLVLLEPTSPQREPGDIDASIERLLDHADAEAIVGVSLAEACHPVAMVTQDPDGFLIPFASEEIEATRRQEFSEVYFLEGTVYISKIGSLVERGGFYHEKTLAYEVPKWKSLEVDDIYDFVQIEAVMEFRASGAVHE